MAATADPRSPGSGDPMDVGEGSGTGAAETHKMGACYNLFDGHELLEYSIASIRSEVSFVCVVYQTSTVLVRF